MKKFLLILITFFTINVYAEINVSQVDKTLKIYDFANLLTEQEENNLFGRAINFTTVYNLDLVFVTIDKNYTNAQNYADDFYDYNNFGIGNTYDGLLVLIDMDTREFYISTTGQAILIYNDYRINSILDDMTYDIQNGNYYAALSTSMTSISNFAAKGIPQENSDSYIDDNGDYIYIEHKEYPLLPFLIISIITSTIILIIYINKNKLVKKAYEASSYIEKDKRAIKNLGDIFLTTHTSRIRINTDSSSSFSSGGSSSTHRSSSGRSHGGGGRRF